MRLSAHDDRRSKKRLREGTDPELGLAYYLFRVHGILPGDYYGRTQGEKDLIWALSSYEANQKAAPRAPRGKAVRSTRRKK